jgi:phage anti-repressor protein
MNEIIKVIDGGEKQTVDARELHAALGVGRDFSSWIKDRIEKYDFVEKRDFEVFTKTGENPLGGRPSTEYALSVSMAKEIAMVENNEKGQRIRQYLIKVEEAWNSPEMVVGRALQITQRQLETYKQKVDVLQIKLDEHNDWCSIRRYNIEYNGNRWDLPMCQRMGMRMSRYCRKQGIEIRKAKDALFGEVNVYPTDILINWCDNAEGFNPLDFEGGDND